MVRIDMNVEKTAAAPRGNHRKAHELHCTASQAATRNKHWTFCNRGSNPALDHQVRSVLDEIPRAFPARTSCYAPWAAYHMLPRLCRCRRVQVQKHPFYQRRFLSQAGEIFEAGTLSDFAFARCA